MTKIYHSQYDGVNIEGDGDHLCAKFDDTDEFIGLGSDDAEAVVNLALDIKERFDELASRLPKTKDGVIVVPHIDDVWYAINGESERFMVKNFEENRGWMAHILRWDMDRCIEVKYCYSSEEAARDRQGEPNE